MRFSISFALEALLVKGVKWESQSREPQEHLGFRVIEYRNMRIQGMFRRYSWYIVGVSCLGSPFTPFTRDPRHGLQEFFGGSLEE